MKRIALLSLAAALILCACSSDDDFGNSDDATNGTGQNTNVTVNDDDDPDDDADIASFTDMVKIKFNGTTADITSSDDKILVTRSGAHITVDMLTNNVPNVCIVLSGSTDDGSLKTYGSQPFVLILDGVAITSTKNAAINNQCKKRLYLQLKDNTVNTLADAATYSGLTAGEDCKAALFSEGQIIAGGGGSLNVKGNCSHAIASDDYFRQYGGTINITGAAKDGLHVNEYIRIDAGQTDITAAGNGMECSEGYIRIVDGTITVNCADDGISASYQGDDTSVTPYICIEGGTLNITTTAQKGMALKSQSDMLISGGKITATVKGVAAKCLKSANNISIADAELTLTTSGAGMYDTTAGDTSSACCIKADNNVTIESSAMTLKSTGRGGKGINCYGLTCRSGNIDITTSGGMYTYSSRLTSSPKGIRSGGEMIIDGGTITVNVAGSGSDGGEEGIESKGTLTINGGDIYVNAYDDGINSTGAMKINGGRIYVQSTANDAIDSNNSITVNGGTVFATCNKSPEVAIDVDNNTFAINGGTVVGLSQGGMPSYPSGGSQHAVLYGLSSIAKDTAIDVKNSDGKSIITLSAPIAVTSTMLLFSSPAVTRNTSYTVSTGGTIASYASSWHGLYTDAVYTGGTTVGTLTTTSNSYTAIGISGGGGGGNNGGGGGGGGGNPFH